MPPTRQSLLRCFSLLVVGLLLPLASSTKMTPHCADGEMACFANMKCLLPSFPQDSITIMPDDVTVCDVRVEIRPYSTKKALIRLKTKEKSIKVSYSDVPAKPLFGCKELQIEEDTKIVYIGDPTIELLNSEPWEEGIACEFMYAKDPLFDATKKVEIQYGNDETQLTVVPGTTNQIGVLLPDFVKCDMDKLTLKDTIDQFVYSEADRRFNKVVCKSEDETLVYLDNSKKAIESIQCECSVTVSPPAQCPTGKWQYKIGESGKTTANVGCQAPGCKHASACAKVVPCAAGSKCPTLEEKDGCKILKCTDSKFKNIKINSKATNETHVTCSQDANAKWTKEDAKFRWMLKETPVDTAECYAPCLHPNKNEELDGAAFTCGADVSTKITKSDGTPIEGEAICDGKTGKWTIGADSVSVKCVAKGAESVTDNPAGASAFALGPLEGAAMGIGGLVLIVGIGFVCYCLVIKPRQAKKKNKKTKTIGGVSSTSKQEQDPGLKTALPVGYVPPITGSNSSNSGAPIKVEVELVEKTAQTPGAPSKTPSLMMNTAVLNTATPSEDQREEFDKEVSNGLPGARVLNPKSQSDGSEPRSVKIGKNGEAYLNAKKRKSKEKKSDEKSSQSEAGTTKKAEKVMKPPVDTGPKPQVFKLNEKEELIRKGATCKANQYPTLADVDSEWEDWDSAKARAAGNVEAGKKPRKDRGKTKDRTKTVPTAVTPENPDAKPSVERTQATKTRNTRTADNNDPDDIGNLVTQLDTTFEQKEADDKKK